MHYLDNAATTRVADTVADTADAVLRAHYANPSSLYAPGAQSEFVLSGARETVAASLGAQPGEIVFTACGSEGNNLAVLGAVKARAAWADHIVVTGYEHPSVQNPVAALEKEGAAILAQVKRGAALVALCVEGKQLSSEELAGWIEKQGVGGCGDLAFVIGSSHGLAPAVKQAAALRFSMGRITLPHQLARLVLCEQIYRAFSINAGSKYHK